ncbi:hypothetical protein H5410_015708 [Solanum commersonii]|uniref:Uncharacterized protein n=1 Tax=Solanum commersonii TaxID=4109 RepID=A0A9J5ZV80_SOLCO|nr:hypothetical protein H5410_015708 [Solanum commersonii]
MIDSGIDSKGFSATYKENEITYSFVTDPVTRDINALINMKQNHMDSLQMELFSMCIFDSLKYAKVKEKIKLIFEMDLPWIHIKGRGRGRIAPSRGNYGNSSYGTRSSQGSSYRSESNSLVIQAGKRTLLNKKTSYHEESSCSTQQLRKDEPWKIFQRYLVNGLYYPGESYKTLSYYEEILISSGSAEFQHFSCMGNNLHEKSYNFSKIIIKQIISVEDWGMSAMKERQISLNNTRMNFTYWDYIQAFDKVLYYNNDKHKHTLFVNVCAKIFAEPIPNWFFNWWPYHGPTVHILPESFLNLYKEWTKVSLDLNRLYHEDHVCWIERIDQIYIFIEFSISWIHKWTPEIGFTEENIPCLYRTY